VPAADAPNGSYPVVPPAPRPGPGDADQAEPPPGLSAPPGLDALVQVCRRRWPHLLGLGLLGAALGVAAAWALVPAKYTAQVLFQIASHPPPGSTEFESEPSNLQRTHAALIRSRPVLRAALAKPEVSALAEVRAHADPAAWLETDLVSDDQLGPGVLRVRLSGDRPEDVAQVLNQVSQVYLSELLHREEARVNDRLRQLQENYRHAAADLRDRRQKLQAHQRELGLTDPRVVEARSVMALQQLAAAQGQRIQLLLDLRKAEE
jgi:hypothetical protein